MCVLYVEILCTDRFRLGWAHDVILLHVTCSCIFHAYVPFFIFFIIICYWLVLFCVCVSLSLSFFWIVCAWHPSAKLLRPGTLFVPRHLLLLILLLFMTGSVMIKLVRTFWRTFLDVAFIRNAKSFFLTSPILIYPLSLTVGVGNPFVISRSSIPP